MNGALFLHSFLDLRCESCFYCDVFIACCM